MGIHDVDLSSVNILMELYVLQGNYHVFTMYFARIRMFPQRTHYVIT